MQSMQFVLSQVKRVVLCGLAVAGLATITASAQTVNGNGTGTNNGFYYSLYSSGGSATMTLGSAGNYAINWSGVNDVVGGKGWNPGSAQAISYNVGSASGYNNISIYGWLTNPLVEYYICELGSLYTGNAQFKGTVSSDGHNYNTYEHQQVNQPSIQGTTTFEQYLDNWGGAGTGSNNTVTTSNHFNHWNSLGMQVGTFNYQILGTEAYNGASGQVNATVWAGSTGGGGGTGGGGTGGGGTGGGATLNTTNWFNVTTSSNLCLDDPNGSTSNGTALQEYSCGNDQYNQGWQFRAAATSGYYNVFNRQATALGWDDTAGSTANGGKMQLYAAGPNNPNQEWKAVSVGNNLYNFVNLTSGLCLDSTSSQGNGVQLQQWACSSGNVNQQFKLTQVQ